MLYVPGKPAELFPNGGTLFFKVELCQIVIKSLISTSVECQTIELYGSLPQAPI